MEPDFRTTVIRLVQFPAFFEKRLEDLTGGEVDYAYHLLYKLSLHTDGEYFTMIDTIQKARLCYNLAELSNIQGDQEKANRYYKLAFSMLIKGGFDLSMKKWVELVSLRTDPKEDDVIDPE